MAESPRERAKAPDDLAQGLHGKAIPQEHQPPEGSQQHKPYCENLQQPSPSLAAVELDELTRQPAAEPFKIGVRRG